MKNDLTITRIKNTGFVKIYEDFLLERTNGVKDYELILTIAVILINSKNSAISKLGYRILVIYSIRTENYQPLYEVSINLGLFPITKYISIMRSEYEFKNSLNLELNDAYIEIYKNGFRYLSNAQKELFDFFRENIDKSVTVVAPTSYGKTDLIISLLSNARQKNVCIITPTKSLLAQTRTRIQNAKIESISKIVVHPEMYNYNDDNIVAVLTQERLLRLLKRNIKLCFDYVIVDEAHSLLTNGPRENLLASCLIILQKRNRNVRYKYLTPFLNDAESINLKYMNNNVEQYIIKEYMKTEKYYVYDMNSNKVMLYDQYIDRFIAMDDECGEDEEFVEMHKAHKNIIYLNKPKSIEQIAVSFANRRNDDISDLLKAACNDIAEYIHPQYNLITCLRKGIIYHHGAVPDSIRIYIEYLYEKITSIDLLITNSTLLEGVNLPAERMFILDNKKGNRNMSASDFKNLVGRVCRFGEIFNEKNGDLGRLVPQIYMVKGNYCAKNANIRKYIQSTAKVELRIEDELDNLLLEQVSIDKENKGKFEEAVEFIENNEEGTINDYNLRHVKTNIGRACFYNGINEIPIFDVEEDMQRVVDSLMKSTKKIDESSALVDAIDKVFINYIYEDDDYEMIKRLNQATVKRYYTMFLEWKVKGASYAYMVKNFLRYWDKIISEKRDSIVYVGRWGDEKRNGIKELWTDISKKTKTQLVNLAIVRIKDEQEFVDNVLIKYIEVLNDLEYIDEDYYNKIKYGTSDKEIMTMIRNGYSLTLSKLIHSKYGRYINVDYDANAVSIDKRLPMAMDSEDENMILIKEVEYYMKQ